MENKETNIFTPEQEKRILDIFEEFKREEKLNWVKATLKNQVQLISERSKECQSSAELLQLSIAMQKIFNIVDQWI